MEKLKHAMLAAVEAAMLPFRLARVFAAYLYTVGVATSQSPAGAVAAIVFAALALCFLCGVYFWGGEEHPPRQKQK